MSELNTEIIMVENHLSALKKVAEVCKELDLMLNTVEVSESYGTFGYSYSVKGIDFDGNEKIFSITTGSCGTIAIDTKNVILYEED